jgi:YhcG PDDEXK nuclease domain
VFCTVIEVAQPFLRQRAAQLALKSVRTFEKLLEHDGPPPQARIGLYHAAVDSYVAQKLKDDRIFSGAIELGHITTDATEDLKAGKFSHADAGQMHLYLNYAREHWAKPGENPPVGLIICATKGVAEAHYALEGLPNKVLAAEYRTVLPNEKLLAEELVRTRRQIGVRPLPGQEDAP